MEGARLRDEILAELAVVIAAATERGAGPPCFASVLVGGDGAGRAAIGYKLAAAVKVGITTRHVDLPIDASQAEVKVEVARLGADPAVHGVFVQLPLPSHLDERAVLDMVPPDKDVDGLSTTSLGRLVGGRAGFVPCTPLAVVRLLERYERPIAGTRAVVIGHPQVTWPIALLLGRRGADATVTVTGADSTGLDALCRGADLLVSAAGRPALVTAGWVKPGASVVDAGTTRTPHGVVGDVDPGVAAVAGAMAPNPGGLGPVTVALLLAATVDAARAVPDSLDSPTRSRK